MLRFIILLHCFSLAVQGAQVEFIPSENTCGAFITASGQEGFPDNIHAALACMRAGFRNVYVGEASELKDLNINFLEENNISYYIIKGLLLPLMSDFDDQVVFFTNAGKEHAAILARQREKQFSFLKNNIPVYCLETLGKYSGRCGDVLIRIATHGVIMKFYYQDMDFASWALNGLLLGYKYEDIEFFYERNGKKEFFLDDYNSAKDYIKNNKNADLEWFEDRIKKEQ